MNLFTIKDDKVTLAPESLVLIPFRKVWDKYKNKAFALEDLSYIYFLCDHKSDFSHILNEEDKKREIRKNIITREKWSDEHLTEAIVLYNQLNKTISSELLESAKKASLKLSEYFNTVNFTEKDSHGKFLHDSKKLSDNLKQLGEIINSLNDLEDIVLKERESNKRLRGDKEKGMFEDPL